MMSYRWGADANSTMSATVLSITAMLFLFGSATVHGQDPRYSNRFTSVTTAMDAYATVNQGGFPPHQNPGDTKFNYYMPDVLTTPISYLQPHQMIDPFATGEKYNRFGYFNSGAFSSTGNYQSIIQSHGGWGMWSIGPSRANPAPTTAVYRLTPYDATNGVLSYGVIMRNEIMQKETGAF